MKFYFLENLKMYLICEEQMSLIVVKKEMVKIASTLETYSFLSPETSNYTLLHISIQNKNQICRKIER